MDVRAWTQAEIGLKTDAGITSTTSEHEEFVEWATLGKRIQMLWDEFEDGGNADDFKLTEHFKKVQDG